MINRNYLQCVACGQVTLTRTQIGHKDLQKHSFPCGGCGVELSFELELDQENAGMRYRQPRNGSWIAEPAASAVKHTQYLSDEILLPPDVPDLMSPFIAGFARFENYHEFQEREAERLRVIKSTFAYLERCAVHLRKGNLELFDKEAQTADDNLNTRERQALLYASFTEQMLPFTLNKVARLRTVLDRIRRGLKRERRLIKQVSDELLSSGKMAQIATEVMAVRRLFVEAYPSIQPLYQLYAWKREYRSLTAVSLTDKRFDALQNLYVRCFETLCRLTVLSMAFELALTTGSLAIAAKHRDIPLAEIWQMSNGNKLSQFAKIPLINEVFVPALDSSFRNAIGHHSAHYNAVTDTIVVSDSKGSGAASSTVGYTEFCDKLVKIYSAFEIGAIYFQQIHLSVDGAYS